VEQTEQLLLKNKAPLFQILQMHWLFSVFQVSFGYFGAKNCQNIFIVAVESRQ